MKTSIRSSSIFYIIFLFIGISFHTSCSRSKFSTPSWERKEIPIIGERPLFKDFMGINGHFTFRPELYSQVCRLVRNYHDLNWDVSEPGGVHEPPYAINGVNWDEHIYGPWKAHGFETDICLQFSEFNAENPNYKTLWHDQGDWAYSYGQAIASYYGPSGNHRLATSIEIGNEPGINFDAALYKEIFKNMASGIRNGDPKIKILTPYVTVSTPDEYSQDLKGIYSDSDILPLYDVINMHSYAAVPPKEGPFNRSYPEDPRINYLKEIDKTIAWRDKYAPDKEIWITEFGYDASTPEAMERRTGWGLELDWQGFTDEQQAQYLVRSFLAFAERDVKRAYLYFYNDEDYPFIHSSSGITRFFEPKTSFWALKQLYETLGDYRLKRVVKKDDNEVYVYEFEHGSDADRLIWVAWSPTGTQSHKKEGYVARVADITLSNTPTMPTKIMHMATSEEEAAAASWKKIGDESFSFTINEGPTYIIFDKGDK